MVLSAPLLTRKRVIKVTAEDPMGSKVAGTSSILVFDLDIKPTAPFEDRRGSGLYRGHNVVGVHGERSGVCSFSCELRGNGAQCMEASLIILLQACGFEQTVQVYQVHSTHANDKTISIDVWEDGVKKGLAGASGNVTFEGETGKRMMCNFEFSGVWQAPIDEDLPGYDPGTEPPLLLQGGTFTLAVKSIKINKFSLNMGCQVVPRMDVDAVGGIAYYMITDYDPILSIDPEADKIAGYDYHGAWLAGTEAAVSLVITNGTDTITFTLPKVQYKEITEGDRDGIQIYDITGQCNHSASGNDAVAIAVA